jgi:ATP adenylyltransferase
MAQERPTVFQQLKIFLSQQMRMSHLYQPLMLRTLIEKGGFASLRDIASSFLAHDESQLEYYVEITKRMPGPVLSRHQLVRRDGAGYRLIPDVQQLTREQRDELLRLCDEAVENYTGRRGRKLCDHRRLSNLQALCYKCNANKGARDDSDLRAVRASMADRSGECLLCSPGDRPIIAQNELALAFYDAYPVTPLHALIVPRRHAVTYFDLHDPERRAINLLLDQVRLKVLAEDKAVEGFNVGMNCGATAGQTIMHCHVHLIPRRPGDVDQPRGGVRAVIPGKADY